MKKKALCTELAAMMLITTTVSAEPWWLSKYRVTFDNKLGIAGNVTLTFASDGGSFIRPITKRYGESISLESYVRKASSVQKISLVKTLSRSSKVHMNSRQN